MMEKYHSKKPVTSDVDRAMLTLRVDFVFQRGVVGVLTSLLCATTVLVGVYLPEIADAMLAWYTLVLVLTLARIVLIEKYKKNKRSVGDAIYVWKKLFIVGTFLNGLCWGWVGWYVLSHAPLFRQELVILVIGGVTAGSVPLLSIIRYAAEAFLLPAILPVIITMTLMNVEIFYFLDFTIALYLIYLLYLSQRSRSIIYDTIRLQFENAKLLKDLLQVKNRLETANERLVEVSTHDPLTHLANRSLFEIHLKESIHYARIHKKMMVLLYIDLDGFKRINDTYGHGEGDYVLLEMSKRLREVIEEKNVIYRIGGDEITIILKDVEDLNAVTVIADTLCYKINQPLVIGREQINVQASIGISVYPLDGQDAEVLLRYADMAMYYAKEHGGNRFHFYSKVKTASSE